MASSSSFAPPSDEFSKEESNLESIYMSVHWSNDKVAIAYYGSEDCVLYMMVDRPEIMGTNVFIKAYFQILPSMILVCPKHKDKVLSALKEMGSEDDNLDKTIKILPSIDFSIAACRQRLTLMNLPGAPSGLTDSEKSIYISTLVQAENSNMTKCVGALLRFLEKNRIGIELEPNILQVPVASFKLFNLEDFLMMDSFTYKSLQIFKEDSHPAGLINHNKEGFSLFSIFRRCKSSAGANMMMHWFKHPLSNLKFINSRLDAVEFFLSSCNSEFVTLLEGAVRNMRNIVPLLRRMVRSQCRHSDWKILQETLLSCLEINDLLIRAGYPKLDVFNQLKDLFANDDLIKLSGTISCMVDFQETAINQRFCVKPNISTELDLKKEIYDKLSNIMAEACARERATLDQTVKECQVMYFPQIGYLLSVKFIEGMEISDGYSLPGREFMFIANGSVYYRTEETKYLDHTYGDVRCDIIDMEVQVMDSLHGEVIKANSLIRSVVLCIAEIDCLLSFATCARMNDYVRPEMVDGPMIQIINGRHPLHELLGTFIANSTDSNYPGKIHVITGANCSGKSVYMKQIGLIIFMAHIGSFVPAHSARLGIIDQIFTKMNMPQSISYQMSSFLMDLNQLSVALKMNTNRSLLLIDEFGRGTQEEDGASLLAATIRHLNRLGSSCPHCFISTHYHIINEAKLLPDSPNIKHMRTKVIVENRDQITYLYEMEDGIAESSQAFAVAKAVGLPNQILRRARQILLCMDKGEPVQPTSNSYNDFDFAKCQKLCNAFLSFDFESENIREFIRSHVVLCEAMGAAK